MIKRVWEVHISQPNAVPISLETPYKDKISATDSGYAPRPPLVKPTARVPNIKPIITVTKEIWEVSGNAQIVT